MILIKTKDERLVERYFGVGVMICIRIKVVETSMKSERAETKRRQFPKAIIAGYSNSYSDIAKAGYCPNYMFMVYGRIMFVCFV